MKKARRMASLLIRAGQRALVGRTYIVSARAQGVADNFVDLATPQNAFSTRRNGARAINKSSFLKMDKRILTILNEREFAPSTLTPCRKTRAYFGVRASRPCVRKGLRKAVKVFFCRDQSAGDHPTFSGQSDPKREFMIVNYVDEAAEKRVFHHSIHCMGCQFDTTHHHGLHKALDVRPKTTKPDSIAGLFRSVLNTRRNDRMGLISLTLSLMSTGNYAACLTSNSSASRISRTAASASSIIPSSFSLIPARQR